jgi:hypothetical protein
MVYSRTLRQATTILTDVKRVLTCLPANMRPLMCVQNKTMIGISTDGGPTNLCTVESRPGKVESVRGETALGVIVDEYGVVTPDFFLRHIIPLMSHTKRVLACISTPAPLSSPMGQIGANIMGKRELYPDTDFFNFTLVCDEHRRQNKPLECMCRLHMLPPWKDAVDMWITRRQMGDANATAFMAELLGEPCDDAVAVFSSDSVAAAFLAEHRVTMRTRPQGNAIYIAIDPASAGPSDLGIISFYYTSTSTAGTGVGLTVIGAESVNTRGTDMDETQQFILAHIRGIRRLYPGITDKVQVIPIVESSGSHLTANSYCAMMLRHAMPCRVVFGASSVSKIKSLGVPTTPDNKLMMIMRMKMLMSENQICVDKKIYSSGERSIEAGGIASVVMMNVQRHILPRSPDETLQMLANQLNAFSPGARGYGANGKLNGTRNDDLAMAALIGFYWSWDARCSHQSLRSMSV